ncbi:hypothetical protein BDF21DRAFT_468626 [Thamnidium elegans]|uniref:Uncharacterized protein n=1 Tax=Thamnidium elegans TaxID=101142 RepID=A0A8H7SR42_9FUNG|nr:hypothetical protein INT48_007601 [Thamnidium elegans]KAI8051831.1 hypothetical protein BDF21DRAFT_468626 [Thamnidium elegans]
MKEDCNLTIKVVTRHPKRRSCNDTLDQRAQFVKEWTLTTDFLKNYPGSSKRIVHQHFGKDVILIKQHVIPGAMSETSISALIKNLSTLGTNDIIRRF